jgi:predicted Zn-ribbon and HTH transcriptional regulator
MNGDTPVVPTCPKCGSEEIATDATARWNTTEQKWEISGLLDPCSCDDCGAEFDDAVWKEVK